MCFIFRTGASTWSSANIEIINTISYFSNFEIRRSAVTREPNAIIPNNCNAFNFSGKSQKRNNLSQLMETNMATFGETFFQ